MAQAPGTAPEICVSQPYGDGYTVYVIHGTGFPRFAPVTVELAGVGVSPDHPVTDLQGTFNYRHRPGATLLPRANPARHVPGRGHGVRRAKHERLVPRQPGGERRAAARPGRPAVSPCPTTGPPAESTTRDW